MGRGYLNFSTDVLKLAFNIPDNAEVYGASWDVENDCARIYIMSPDLESFVETAPPPQIFGMVDRLSDDELCDWFEKEATSGDREGDHGKADEIIAQVLRQLGMAKSAKWYEHHTDQWWYA